MKTTCLSVIFSFVLLNLFAQQQSSSTAHQQLKQKAYTTHLNANGKKDNYASRNSSAFKQLEIQGMGAIGNWEQVGPFNTQKGMGRVNCVAFIDANTWLVGTAGGGLWKTDVAGVYNPQLPGFDKPWIPLTDKTTATGISGIAVKPSSPDKIYILTGDGDRQYTFDYPSYFYEDASIPSIGILKTTDGGNTWNETALKFESNELVYPHKLLMNYSNPNRMYAATSNGLYITGDSWATKSLILAGINVWDVEIHPTNGNIIYISTDSAVYLSTDGLTTEPKNISKRIGGNFLYGNPSRTNLAVSAAAPDNLYVAAGNENFGLSGIYISANKGSTFTMVYNGLSQLNLIGSEGTFYKYGYGSPQYNLAFAVDPANANKIMIGGIDIHVSYSQGILWAQATKEESTGSDYVHKSIHTIEFNPYNNTIVCGTEGGIYASSGNNDTYWEKRWAGMTIAQYNQFDVNNSSSYFATEIIGAAMNNGTDANGTAAVLSSVAGFSPADFDKIGGKSGYYCFSGSADGTDYRYTEDGTGHLFLQERNDFTGWNTTDISPDDVFDFYDDPEGPKGNRGIPIAVNPNEFQSILAGYGTGGMFFSNDFGDDWSELPLPQGTAFNGVDVIAWNKNNGNHVAYSDDESGKIVSTNQFYGGIISGNYNWRVYDTDSLINNATITGLAFTDDAYPNNIVFTADGYIASKKVFRLMKDSTWKNISYNLPNTQTLCVTADENGIYTGTDIGIFFLANKDSVWSYFSKGLPTVPVTQIEVVQDILGRRVYCSTYGRGIWKSDPAPAKRVTRYYVNKSAAGANTGLSWADAFTKVQDAIYKSIPGDSIWVAKGTYYPTSTYTIAGGTAVRSYTFIIDSNTVMYGGFYGDETRLEQRNTSLYETILSGNLGDTSIAGDNSYHVLTFVKSTKNSLIDGFRIRDGFANGSNSVYPSTYHGGAILLDYDSTNIGRPFFKNCEFVNNLAAKGGAIYISQYFKSDAKTSFLKCTFSQNYSFNNAYGEGGGTIYVDASNGHYGPFGTVSLVIDSCLFQYNSSASGGAIYNDAQEAGNIRYTINQTQFLHNKTTGTTGYGGAITNYTGNKGKMNLTFNNCTFLDDDAPNGAGGALYNVGSQFNDDDMQLYIKNCSFDSCSGYAIYSTGGKIFLNVDKSTFSNNTGAIQHVGATVDSASFGKITNCTFNNTYTAIYLNCGNSGTGLTNRSINYSIDSCTFTNNSYGLYLYNYSVGGNTKHAQYTLKNSTFTNNALGAVYNLASDNGFITATLKKNTFTNNQGTNGGAMYSYSSSNGIIELYIDSCNFTGNKASAGGGALYNYNTDIVSVSNCNFTNDTAATGGAVYNSATYKNVLYKMDFRNCTYTNNKATGSAGALFFASGGFSGMNVNVIKNTFNGNTAANYGGSFYTSTSATYDTLTLNIDSCSFNNNTTTQSHGGAVYLYNSGGSLFPVIKNSEFKNNHTTARGGAIYAEVSGYQKLNLSLLKCNIESNSSNLYGGALTITSLGTSNLTIDSCTLKNNSAVSAIGGIYIYQNSFQFNASIQNTIFDGNNTPGYSGALQMNADGLFTGSANNCIFKNNTATGGVAGAVRLYAYDADLNDFDFNNCLFDNNTAGDNGGAAYIQTDLRGILANKFDNCVFNKNKAARGGALYLTASNYAANISVPLTNCTIANNNGIIETGGIYVTRTNTSAIVHADLVNTILWNNTDAGVTANKKQAYVSGGAAGFVKNSLIKDSIPAGYADSASNVFSDPLFTKATDVDGADNIFATADDGFTVKNGSPAINAGTIVSLTTDITGLARPQGNVYDIGAYEKFSCSAADVTGLAVSTITSCTLKYTWNAAAGATSYEAAYKTSASGTWISLGDIGNVLTKTVTGLTANTAYDFRVRAKNAGGCTGNWAQLLNLKTDLYDEPENLSEANITATSAKLKWQVPACGNAVINYTVKYKSSVSSSWITVTAAGASYSATGLSAATQYNWKVRANYSGGSSEYTAIRNFTTTGSLALVSNQSARNTQMVLLEQNIPNPFANTTTIIYTLPQAYNSAFIVITDKNGKAIKRINISRSSRGSIKVDAAMLSSGVYQYSLYADGKLMAVKQMAVVK